MPRDIQFGNPLPGRTYRDRPAAFGILEKDGKIAFVRIKLTDGTTPYTDLPGGAIDDGETAGDAVVREFAEETGLVVAADGMVGRAAQYFATSKGDTVNNLCAFFSVSMNHGVATKVEDDHELIWLPFEEGLAAVRHDAHAWGLTAWRRRMAASETPGL